MFLRNRSFIGSNVYEVFLCLCNSCSIDKTFSENYKSYTYVQCRMKFACAVSAEVDLFFCHNLYFYQVFPLCPCKTCSESYVYLHLLVVKLVPKAELYLLHFIRDLRLPVYIFVCKTTYNGCKPAFCTGL